MRSVLLVLAMVIASIVAMTSAQAQPLQVGDRAPDFRLPATTGGLISLSDYRGEKNVLIEFYHTDWGPDCTANLVTRRDDYDLFAGLDVVVLAISLSHSYSQAAFAQSLGLPYPLLSDYPDGGTVRAYGVGFEEGEAKRLFARPSFFLIDKEGIIRDIGVSDQQPSTRSCHQTRSSPANRCWRWRAPCSDKGLARAAVHWGDSGVRATKGRECRGRREAPKPAAAKSHSNTDSFRHCSDRSHCLRVNSTLPRDCWGGGRATRRGRARRCIKGETVHRRH